jgi:flagellar basal-body rod protein FlgG
MLDSLYIGATGMQAQQANLDVIANNMANVNTAGFKRNRIDFEDLLYRALPKAASSGASSPAAGMGTAASGSDKLFSVGDVKQTSQPYDLAINGQGFFELTLPDGTVAYTRSGVFHLTSEGTLVSQDGYPLAAQITVPVDATAVTISSDGAVQATVPKQQKPVHLGQINLVSFLNPNGLQALGNNLYVANSRTDGSVGAAGDPQQDAPGQNGAGTLAQGYLEASNVNLIDEMVNLVIAQRAYEVNSKVVMASDQLLSIGNNLYR